MQARQKYYEGSRPRHFQCAYRASATKREKVSNFEVRDSVLSSLVYVFT